MRTGAVHSPSVVGDDRQVAVQPGRRRVVTHGTGLALAQEMAALAVGPQHRQVRRHGARDLTSLAVAFDHTTDPLHGPIDFDNTVQHRALVAACGFDVEGSQVTRGRFDESGLLPERGAGRPLDVQHGLDLHHASSARRGLHLLADAQARPSVQMTHVDALGIGSVNG
jgi:hypothetical protein